MRTQRFVVCVNRFDDPRGRTWLVGDYVRRRRRWRATRDVAIAVPVETRVRQPPSREQPRAWLAGRGRILYRVARTVIDAG